MPETIITLVLPENAGLLAEATIAVKRGDLATVGTFQYSTLEDIAAALHAYAEQLLDVEEAAPSLPDMSDASDYTEENDLRQHLKTGNIVRLHDDRQASFIALEGEDAAIIKILGESEQITVALTDIANPNVKAKASVKAAEGKRIPVPQAAQPSLF